MKTIKRVSFPSPIHKIKNIGKNKLGILSIENSFRVFSLEKYDLIGGFKTLLPQNSLTLANADFSPNGLFVAFYNQDEKKEAVFYTKNKKNIYQLNEHKGLIESVSYAPNSFYLATGGQDGKVYLWNMKSGKMISSLPPHSDYVSTMAFSPNGQWFASGGYDNQINITNISTMGQKFKLKGHKAALTQMLYINNQKLIAADKAGEIVIWNPSKQRVIQRLPKMLDEVTAMTISSDERFLFAVDKTKRVTLFDINTHEVLSWEYIKLQSNCKTVVYSELNNLLIFGLSSGELLIYDIFEQEEEIYKDIDSKRYDKAYARLEQNPLLQYKPVYDMLESQWQFNIEIAVELLQKGKQKEAKTILKPFQVNAQKRLFTQKILKDFVAFEKFKTAVETKKYPLAYSLASQYSTLEQTQFFHKMEDDWHNRLEMVKKIILEKDGDEKANELLKLFKGVSSKAKVIQSIFEEKQMLVLFQKKIAEQSYKEAMMLASQNPFLESFDEYHRLMENAQKLEEQTRAMLTNGKYAQVIKVSDKLESYPHKSAIAKQLRIEANAYAQAMKYSADKNYAPLYKMVTQYPFLEDSQVIQDIEKIWNKKVFEAESYAVKGDVKVLKEMFHGYLSIDVKLPKIAQLFKIAYLAQMKKEIKNKNFTNAGFKSAIQRYIAFFGIDDLIANSVEMIRRYRKNFRINLDLILEEGDDISWVKKELPYSIFNINNE